MKPIFPFLTLLAATSACLHAQQPAAPLAQVVYYHGDILTGDGLSTNHPARVTALAVRDGVVVGAGRDGPILRRWAGAGTERIDLQGAWVVPGLNDAHVHLAAGGEEKLSIDLVGSQSLAEMLRRIRNAAKNAAPGAWLRGWGWDHTLWANAALPTRSDLDGVTGGHPAIFNRVDGHIAVVNSAALAAAGITDQTSDPQGGRFDRDARGHLTGMVREGPALDMIARKIPARSLAERKQALRLALADAACHGLTSVQDYSPGWENFQALEALEQAGQLPIRVSEWLTFNDGLDTLERERGTHPRADRMLNLGMLKGFMDGSVGSRTAAMLAPYADDASNRGIARYTQANLNAMTVIRAKAGFQIGFHAIGDRANTQALDAFAAAEAANPAARQLRFRIEHAQVVSPGDFERFHQLGVIASMQPNHLLSDMRWAKARLGAERTPYSYAWKSFLDHGVALAFGTDYPVEPITPYRGIYAAVTRRNEAGTMTYEPSQKLTIGQALAAYTQGSAYAQFDESWKGRLEIGYVADFTVLDRDLTKIAPQEILRTRVLRTVVNGKTVACAAAMP